ncbi:hypothetical protein G7Y89_g15355 [Cudoniella acicularis]|uniref:Uncharacterized protein n=1 Tax=Cudoniella acicularis TaxID=354080 RepID=A0A8H4VLK7_9HELO|nr:hypothetical protein G7Y89_g15355 [Cudoniella acicularis]
MPESTPRKLLPILLMSITTLVSALLVLFRDRRDVGELNNFVEQNRATLGILVQILASLLGMCLVYAMCSALNFSTRLYLEEKDSVSLQTLGFWSGLVTPGLDLSLSKHMVITLIFWSTITRIPGALWAGALTPVFTPLLENSGDILVPTYPLSASLYWDGEFVRWNNGEIERLINCSKTTDERYQGWTGPFVSSCPDIDFISALQASAGFATTTSISTPWVHTNLISKDWSFIGRSYGVGSSPGLVDPPQNTSVSIYAYNYTEYGYFTNVTCLKNESSTYELVSIGEVGTTDTNISLWAANGTLPNSVPGSFESYPVATYNSETGLFAWSSVVSNKENLIAVAAPPGSWYEKWNKMQCSVDFQPRLFAVAANLTSKTVSVTPLPGFEDTTDIEPAGNLTANVMLSLDRLSRMGNNFDQSALGGPITFNVINVQRSNPDLTEQEADLRGLEDSISAVLDDLLVAFGAAETVLANASMPTPFSGSYIALRIGSDQYIFAIFSINVALLLSLVAEAGRTQFWKGLTKFNYADVKRVVVATSTGAMRLEGGTRVRYHDDSGIQLMEYGNGENKNEIHTRTRDTSR